MVRFCFEPGTKIKPREQKPPSESSGGGTASRGASADRAILRAVLDGFHDVLNEEADAPGS